MNRTVGKLARDGPSNICHFNRSRLCCEIGFWFYHCCFAKEKRGGVAVSLYAGGAMWSWLGAMFLMGKTPGSRLTLYPCGIPTVLCDSCPLLGSCMSTERKQFNPGACSAGGPSVQSRYLIVPLGAKNRQVVAVGTSSLSTSIHCDWPR